MHLDEDTLVKLRGLILFTVAAVVAGANWRALLDGALHVVGYLMPFVTGACLAFVLNIPMRFLEKRLLGRLKSPSLRRAAGLLLTLFLVVLVFALAILIVIPQLASSLMTLQYRIPFFFRTTTREIQKYVSENPDLMQFLNNFNTDLGSLFNDAKRTLSNLAGGMLTGSLLAAKGIAGALTNFGIAFIFSIYLLLGKEKLKRQFEALAAVVLPKDMFLNGMQLLRLISQKFSAFITGQCLEACILGMMFFVTLSIIRLPYAALIGVTIAVTALIPVFGAFVGLFLGAFLMLLQSPVSALVFVVVFFVLQQIEGNLIYPHVVGSSVDLPAIWVLVAVTLGGAMFGVVGMLCFIPAFSVFYELLRGVVREKGAALERKENSRAVSEKAETDQNYLEKAESSLNHLERMETDRTGLEKGKPADSFRKNKNQVIDNGE